MQRLALLAAALLAGCGPKVPTVEEIQPLIAVAGTYSVLSSSTTPAPVPVQGDVCPDCYGRGLVGDGTNMMKCQRCGGTGKIVTHPPVILHDCRSGTCQKKTPSIVR